MKISFMNYLENPEKIHHFLEEINMLIEEIRIESYSLKSLDIKEHIFKVGFRPNNPLRHLEKIDRLSRQKELLLIKDYKYKRRISELINLMNSQEEKQIIISRYFYMLSIEEIVLITGIPKKEVEKTLHVFMKFALKRRSPQA